MNIDIEDKVNFKHFSNNINYIAAINKIDGSNLHLKFIKNRKDFILNAGEPAVLIFNSEIGIFIKGCIILEVYRKEEIIIVSCDENYSGTSKRVFERYPVSHDSDLRLLSESKRYATFIKDISKYGFKFFTNMEMPIGQIIEISPYLNKKIVFVSATVVRCIHRDKYFEYGAEVKVNDLHSVQELSNTIKITREEYIHRYIATDELKKLQISSFELDFDAVENRVIFEASKNLNEATVKLQDLLKRMRY